LRRFVIFGPSPLSEWVAGELLKHNGHVTGLVDHDQRPWSLGEEGQPSEDQEPLKPEAAGDDLEGVLKRIVDEHTECLLALSDRREDNLRVALIASQVAPGLDIVLRAFGPALAGAFERSRGKGLRVRSAYSMAHLSAPYFVASALIERWEGVALTAQFGEEYVTVCELAVGEERRRRLRRRGVLLGQEPSRLRIRRDCQVLARRSGGDPWRVARTGRPDEPLGAHERVLLGGRLPDVFSVIQDRRMRLVRLARRRRRARSRPSVGATPLRRAPGRTIRRTKSWLHDALTLGVPLLAALLVVVWLAVFLARPEGLADAFYRWASTALGEPGLEDDAATFVRLVTAIGLLSGGVALGLGISLASAFLIERRIPQMGHHRARRLRNHVVVVGLCEIGVRVAELLDQIGMPFAVVDPPSDPASEAARLHVSEFAPVLSGDLESALVRASIDRALALIACSSDNMANIEACIRAKRGDTAQTIRTVARIFDDKLARKGAEQLGVVDAPIAAVESVAPAFVDAALYEHPQRRFRPDDRSQEFVALRWKRDDLLTDEQLEQADREGVRVLATWRDEEGPGLLPRSLLELGDAEWAMLAGPPEAMKPFARADVRGKAPEPVSTKPTPRPSAGGRRRRFVRTGSAGAGAPPTATGARDER
jgi:Trk K+ transport system NAD-binding subunit